MKFCCQIVATRGIKAWKAQCLRAFFKLWNHSHSANSNIWGCIWGGFTGKAFANMLIFHLLFVTPHFLSIKIVSQKSRDCKGSRLCKSLSKSASNWGQFRLLDLRSKLKEADKHPWGLPAMITAEQDRAGQSMAANEVRHSSRPLTAPTGLAISPITWNLPLCYAISSVTWKEKF